VFVHRSNRTERLVEVLAEVVARPLADHFARECVVVQGKGMERWLSMELARLLGVWANADFPFPRHLIDRAITAVLGEDGSAGTAFEPESLLWSIAELLPAHLDRGEFAPIRNYLAEDVDGLKRIQLAERIADTFDHYVIYRPTMVLAWEAGEKRDWQDVLWRALVARHGSVHLAARARRFLDALTHETRVGNGFPKRISLFGISTLPPLYVHLLEALSQQVETHLFVLSPSREYWAEIRSKRDVIRELSRRQAGAVDAEEALHLEEGHPLLASLGRVGRDFQQVLEDATHYDESERDLYEDPAAGNMLATLQSDILNLRHRGQPPFRPPLVRGDERGVYDRSECSLAGEARELSLDDDSISIHSCHSPMREVEVLHDRLLALFDKDPNLEPRDVVVMTPEIDRYAPFVEAVFGQRTGTSPRIPYCIADRSVRATSSVLDAFAQLIDVIGGRFSVSSVLDLLGLEVIRDRFRISAEEVETLREWTAETGIRWGIDAEHRASVGQPPLVQNTWRFGLDRLLLGYAMPGRERTLYADVLPYDDVEGTNADLLGRLAEFCATLFRFHSLLAEARPPAAWRDSLSEFLEAMIVNTGPMARERQQIRLALASVAESARVGGFAGNVGSDAIRTLLDGYLQRRYSARGFLSGGVTFCELVPMRTIPFRVVCLMGLNDGAFPRTRRPLGFDLIAHRPTIGDRSQREDDRYLFLESILSARDKLLITYVGQSIRDNAEMPPSVVVSELLDAVEETFPLLVSDERGSDRVGQALGRESRGVSSLVLYHPLQPFSPRYFQEQGDSRVFSYSASSLAGARRLLTERQKAPPFVAAPIPLDAQEPRSVTLEELVRFFQSPAREFLRRRIDLYLEQDEAPLDDREPADLSGLERWAVGEALLSRALQGEDLQAAFESVRGTGRLPLGVPGKCVYDRMITEVAALKERAQALRSGPELDALEVDVEVDGTRITGLLRNLWNVGQVRCQYARISARWELGMWIRHVVLNCTTLVDIPRETVLVGRPTKGSGAAMVSFRPPDDPKAVLTELLRLYWLGHQQPLPLFPETSRAYAEAIAKAGEEEGRQKAIESARRQFEGWPGSTMRPEADDPDVQQIYGDDDPLDPVFRLPAEGSGDVLPPDERNGTSERANTPLNPPLARGEEKGGGSAIPTVGNTASFADIALVVFGPLLAHREAA
jgi:exodeoxyribonuclease V gamma subunit